MGWEDRDLRPYWAAWDKRLKREGALRRSRAEERRSRALGLVPRLAKVLLETYGARKVFLVGSLARGDVGQDSDIDLVVEGLPGGTLFRAGAELERMAGDIPVDLIPLEAATDRLRAALAREGVAVHVPD